MVANQLLKPNEVAIALNISRSFAYFLIRTGQIPSVRIGQSAVRVRPQDLETYIQQNTSGNQCPTTVSVMSGLPRIESED